MSESSAFRLPDGVGNPLRHLIARYVRPYARRYAAAVGTVLAQIPQRVPALVVGVALDAILFADAVEYDGVSFAYPDADDIEAAARKAGAHEFVAELDTTATTRR